MEIIFLLGKNSSVLFLNTIFSELGKSRTGFTNWWVKKNIVGHQTVKTPANEL
jgi:hypothetical protein